MGRTDRVLLAASALGMGVLLYMVLAPISWPYVVPNERTMGFVQRIFYIHVPCAWVAFLAFGVTAVAGVMYLATRNRAHDRLAAASAEVGVVYTTLVLITGPLWARPVWGIWWSWDLRLTTTFVLWLMFLGYLVLRRSLPDPDRRAVLSSVVGIVAFLDVPVVYLANRVKASQHPAPVIAGGDDSGLEGIFLFALLWGFAALTVQYVLILRARVRNAELEDRLEEISYAPNPGGM